MNQKINDLALQLQLQQKPPDEDNTNMILQTIENIKDTFNRSFMKKQDLRTFINQNNQQVNDNNHSFNLLLEDLEIKMQRMRGDLEDKVNQEEYE